MRWGYHSPLNDLLKSANSKVIITYLGGENISYQYLIELKAGEKSMKAFGCSVENAIISLGDLLQLRN